MATGGFCVNPWKYSAGARLFQLLLRSIHGIGEGLAMGEGWFRSDRVARMSHSPAICVLGYV